MEQVSNITRSLNKQPANRGIFGVRTIGLPSSPLPPSLDGRLHLCAAAVQVSLLTIVRTSPVTYALFGFERLTIDVAVQGDSTAAATVPMPLPMGQWAPQSRNILAELPLEGQSVLPPPQLHDPSLFNTGIPSIICQRCEEDLAGWSYPRALAQGLVHKKMPYSLCEYDIAWEEVVEVMKTCSDEEMATHIEEAHGPFCDECGASFRDVQGLVFHAMMEHPQLPMCAACGTQFTYPSTQQQDHADHMLVCADSQAMLARSEEWPDGDLGLDDMDNEMFPEFSTAAGLTESPFNDFQLDQSQSFDPRFGDAALAPEFFTHDTLPLLNDRLTT